LFFFYFKNKNGQLGLGNEIDHMNPFYLNWNQTTKISAGLEHSFIVNNGNVFGFGTSQVFKISKLKKVFSNWDRKQKFSSHTNTFCRNPKS
jgi:hypothetical protein